jgi:hypothetical protein
MTVAMMGAFSKCQGFSCFHLPGGWFASWFATSGCDAKRHDIVMLLHALRRIEKSVTMVPYPHGAAVGIGDFAGARE